MPALTLILWLAVAAVTMAAEQWTSSDIGAPAQSGLHQWTKEVLTVRGSGKGAVAAHEDQLHFVSIPAEGDVEIVARLASFDGTGRAEAGMMIRAGEKPDAPMAAVAYLPQASHQGKDGVEYHAVELRGREPGNPYSPATRGALTPLAPPLWLKLVRVGNDFAVYKSDDGTTWSCAANDTGSAFTAQGAIRAGFYVSNGEDAGAPATAVFDSIYVGKPRLAYRTSWIGSQYNADSTGYVSNNVAALYVAPDGTCYTNSAYDEVAEAMKIYKSGKVVGTLPQPYGRNNLCREGTITGDGQHIYFYSRFKGVTQMDLAASESSARAFQFNVPLAKGKDAKGDSYITGMGVGKDALYVSYELENKVLVADLKTLAQVPERTFAVERPGPIAVDRRGDLWITQRRTAEVTGLIACYTKDGQPTGRKIADLEDPAALCYDAVNDRLLVCERGADQNVRIYTELDNGPVCRATFGRKKGVWGAENRSAGGEARLHEPNAVGVDADGNIYVNCSGDGTDLRKYTPAGNLLWQLNALFFVDSADFDPATDGRELYAPFKHLAMDYARSSPGTEWSPAGNNWNRFRFGARPPKSLSTQVRRLGDENSLVSFMSAQGTVQAIHIYRYEKELAIPCGRITPEPKGVTLWNDRNGDGLEQPEEITSAKLSGNLVSYHADTRGDLWTAWNGVAAGVIRQFYCQSVDGRGIPKYGLEKGDFAEFPFPAEIAHGPSLAPRLRHDAEHDALYIVGYNANPEEAKKYPQLLARYDGLAAAQRGGEAAWVTKMPAPQNSPNFIGLPPVPSPQSIAFAYQALDIAGEYVFAVELWGPVHVFSATTGQQVLVLNPGPEVSGLIAWEDAHDGIHATRRTDGEYEIVVQNSGFRGRNTLYRWHPQQ